jgi:DNA-binding transcriptional ArsR family regulator/rhodanese-related sulfurtransferase
VSDARPAETRQPTFDALAAMAAALGSPARLKILHVLAQAPRGVEAVSSITGERVANASQHLQRLRREGLVACRKAGLSRIYGLADPAIGLLLEDLFDLAERVSPALRQPAGSVPAGDEAPVAYQTVADEMRRKKAVLLDIRDAQETAHTPVEGAVRLPLDDLPRRARRLARTRTYYVLCRGRACERAVTGVRLLRAMGFRAYRLKESPAALRARARQRVA